MQKSSGILGNRGEPASNASPKGEKHPSTTLKEVAIAEELEGTSVQSLARGSDSTQEPTQKTSGSLGNRGEPASKPSQQHGKPQKTNTKNVGFPREPEGTSVQSLAGGRGSTQKLNRKTSGFLGKRGEPASKPFHQHGKQQKTSAKNVGFPREPEGTSVQSPTHARKTSENKCKNRREF